MLQRDYVLAQINLFVQTVLEPLRLALEELDLDSVHTVEQAVGKLIDIDADTALALSTDSLVTMMKLSGICDSVAGYASYALARIAASYERMGKKQTAEVRRDQARKVAVAFGWNLSDIPEEFEDLEKSLRG